MNPLNLSQQRQLLLAALAVVLLTFGCYWDVLGYGLTGCDTMTLIETGRIRSFEDLRKTFTSSLMEGSAFSSNFKYYRPISSLSYALDYALWGLEPLGYMLHNVLLHGANGLLLFWLTFRISKRVDIAFVTAALFVCNPVLIESVPGIPRRQDILPIFFLLLALLSNSVTDSHPRRNLFVAMGCAATALGLMSKESAALIVVHIFTYNLLVPMEAPKRLRRAILRTGPYVCTVIPVLLWRASVLGGIGGTWREFAKNSRDSIIFEFAYTLFSPITFIFPGMQFGAVATGVVVVVSLVWFGPILHWLWRSHEGKTVLFGLSMITNALTLYLLTAVYGPWMAYSSAPPYAMVLAASLISATHYLRDASVTVAKPRRLIGVVALCFWFGVVLLQYRFSPLIVRYTGWEHSAKFNQQVLDQITSYVGELPNPGLITIRNVPFRHYTGKDPTQVRSVTYLKAYTIKSYLNLIEPDNDWFVVYRDPYSYRTVPETVEVEYTQLGPQHGDLTVRYPGFNPDPSDKLKIIRVKRSERPKEAKDYKQFNEGNQHPFRGRTKSRGP